MRKTLITLSVILVSLSSFSQEKQTIIVSEDGYTYSGKREGAYGKLNSLKVIRAKGSTVLRHTLLKFDLSSISTSKTINKAIVKLYCQSNTDSSEETLIDVSETPSNWREEDLTWANQPKPTKKIGQFPLSGSGKYIEFDITNYIKETLKAGGKETSLRISDPKSTGTVLEFASKELKNNPPILEIF